MDGSIGRDGNGDRRVRRKTHGNPSAARAEVAHRLGLFREVQHLGDAAVWGWSLLVGGGAINEWLGIKMSLETTGPSVFVVRWIRSSSTRAGPIVEGASALHAS
jgi:hypothetical protein